MVNRRLTFGNWYGVALAILVFVMLVFPKLNALGILLFVPLLVVGIVKKTLGFSFNWMNLLFIALYGLYFAYCLFTRHWDWASKYLEYKLSFLIFPLIFSFVPKEKPDLRLSALTFIIGTVILIFWGAWNANQCMQDGGVSSICWFTSSFSHIHHPSYSSVFYTVAIFLVWYVRYQKWFPMPWILATGLTVIYVLALGLCMSFAGLLFLLISFGVFLLIVIRRKWGKKAMITVTLLLPIALAALVYSEPHLKGQYLEAERFTTAYWKDPESFIRNEHYPMPGSAVRLVMWTAATKAACDYPLGVGTGNVDEVLSTYLRSMNQKELAKLNYNPHNQYLQTTLEVGVIGLTLLLAILVLGLWIGWKNRNWLLILITSNLMFNMLFESMLQRQSGVVFFSLAICLLIRIPKSLTNT